MRSGSTKTYTRNITLAKNRLEDGAVKQALEQGIAFDRVTVKRIAGVHGPYYKVTLKPGQRSTANFSTKASVKWFFPKIHATALRYTHTFTKPM